MATIVIKKPLVPPLQPTAQNLTETRRESLIRQMKTMTKFSGDTQWARLMNEVRIYLESNP